MLTSNDSLISCVILLCGLTLKITKNKCMSRQLTSNTKYSRWAHFVMLYYSAVAGMLGIQDYIHLKISICRTRFLIGTKSRFIFLTSLWIQSVIRTAQTHRSCTSTSEMMRRKGMRKNMRATRLILVLKIVMFIRR
jgi:hypothetical protein